MKSSYVKFGLSFVVSISANALEPAITGVPIHLPVSTGPSPADLTNVSPSHVAAAGGTSIVISGNGIASGAHVTINLLNSKNSVVSSSPCLDVQVALVPGQSTAGPITPKYQAGCTVPSGAGQATVVVTNPGAKASNAMSFSYDPPLLTSLTPASGYQSGGNSISILGSGFSHYPAVTINDGACASPVVTGFSAAMGADSGTKITCKVPAGSAPGPANVVVTSPNGQPSAPLTYTYLLDPSAAPVGVSPAYVPSGGGSQLTITGTGFTGRPSVTVGGAPCTNVVALSTTVLTCTAPAESAAAQANGDQAAIIVTNFDSSPATAPNFLTYVPYDTVLTVPAATLNSIIARYASSFPGCPTNQIPVPSLVGFYKSGMHYSTIAQAEFNFGTAYQMWLANQKLPSFSPSALLAQFQNCIQNGVLPTYTACVNSYQNCIKNGGSPSQCTAETPPAGTCCDGVKAGGQSIAFCVAEFVYTNGPTTSMPLNNVNADN